MEGPEWAAVTGVLLDPSCSGSGTAHNRMDFLLPSAWQGDATDASQRAAASQVPYHMHSLDARRQGSEPALATQDHCLLLLALHWRTSEFHHI